MSRRMPGHGDENRYKWYNCRCMPCTRAASRADAVRKLARLSGRPCSIPAGPVTAHVRALMAQNLSPRQIAHEAGVQASTVRRIAEGQETVHSTTARKLLAVPLNVQVSSGQVPALGCIRRVRALYALGHANRVIVQTAGVSRDAVCDLANGKVTVVKVATDAKIRAAYDRLAMATGTSWKTRKLAQDEGWAPPLAWDDDTIDDPNAMPMTDAAQPVATEGGNVAARWLLGESVVLGPEDRKQVVQHLFEWTELTKEQIAARLEMTPAAVEQIWMRIKRKARLEGRPVPWRRVYALRDKDLKQNEMGEAA